jgi:hypothetical protein
VRQRLAAAAGPGLDAQPLPLTAGIEVVLRPNRVFVCSVLFGAKGGIFLELPDQLALILLGTDFRKSALPRGKWMLSL